MTIDDNKEGRFDRLRLQAEDLIKRQPEDRPPASTDILALIHELRISQAELEIQNDELRRAHQEIAGLHQEYLDLYEHAPCGYITLSAKGIVTRINHVGRVLLGDVGKNRTPSGFSRYIARGWEDVYWNALKRSGETGEEQSLELKLSRENGTDVWVRADIRADRSNSKAVLQWRLTIVEITAKKMAEEALKKSEAFATKVTNSSLCGIYIYDLKAGRTVLVNPRFTRMSGLTLTALDEMDEADFFKRFHREDRPALRAHVQAVAAASDEEVFEVEYRFKRTDGRWMSCLSRDAVFSRDADGTVRELIGTFIDITASRRAEAKLHQLNANLEQIVDERTGQAEKRALELQKLALALSRAEDQERHRLAGVLHDDLQQHLAYIKLKTDMAVHDSDIKADHPARREFQSIIELLKESIDICRKVSHELSPVELQRNGLQAALKSMLDDFDHRYGLRVDMDIDPNIEPGSPVLSSILFRSVRECLHNIVKHSGVDSADLDIFMEGDRILVDIMDHGKGCDLDGIRSKKGNDSGFGLFSIQERMNFLGGQVTFRSAPGKGFCVSLMMPNITGKDPHI